MTLGKDENSTIWEIKDHTIAKHEILRKYLEAWIPILGQTSQKIIFLDGFAGPGVYKGGEDGSPVIALETAYKHLQINKIKEIKFIFIEEDKKRYENLDQVIHKKFLERRSNIKFEVINGDFTKSWSEILNKIEKNDENLDPTFAFLDPFGYSKTPFNVIKKLLKYPRCELFLTFMSGFMNRFLDVSRESTIDDFYGTKSWRKARDISNTNERLDYLVRLYFEQLKSIDIKFTRSFTMTDQDKKTIYDLIFATKHWKGMHAMKKAMLDVQKNGTYVYSDSVDRKQTYLSDIINDFPFDHASQLILKEFSNQKILIEDIRDFVLAETPYLFARDILKHMEKNKKILSVTKRGNTSRLTYPDQCVVTFAKYDVTNPQSDKNGFVQQQF